ncbi:MAG: aldehyde oxygenase (deformylating) [Halothece sp.]
MSQSQANQTIDFYSEAYRDSFSRINGIVIIGEQEAHDNFLCLAQLLPENAEVLTRLGKIEARHRKSFEACARNLNVTPDLAFSEQFFADLHQQFQEAAADGKIATCLLIQSIVIECFAIAAYKNYIPVADDFARKVTQAVTEDEYSHLNFGEIWLKAHFDQVKHELKAANRKVLPIVWRMLNQVETDAKVLGINKQSLIEDFIAEYSEALSQIGFSTSDIVQISIRAIT